MSRPPIYVYLAGPIFGATGAEANDWRKDMTARLAPHNIVGISPLRCEPIVGDRYDTQYNDPCFGTAKAIVSKNYLDLVKCDFTLVYMPKPPAVDELAAIIKRMEGFPEIIADMVGLDCRGDDDLKAFLDDTETLKRLALLSPQR
jgi:hypothetical protein